MTDREEVDAYVDYVFLTNVNLSYGFAASNPNRKSICWRYVYGVWNRYGATCRLLSRYRKSTRSYVREYTRRETRRRYPTFQTSGVYSVYRGTSMYVERGAFV